MAVRRVLRMGSALLLEKSAEVREFGGPELHSLVDDLYDTMKAEEGAGIAAPQIGVLLRVVLFGFAQNKRYPDRDPVPETVLINPVIEPMSEAIQLGWEGCLSVPGLRGEVPRYQQIRYWGYDLQGNKIEREVEGFHARLVQHECDHLDGILYPQRIQDMTQFGFLEEIADKLGC
ncbi:MAG: peptide deformylase [Gammaproteobacteria bacterium]|nr:peptide deformylase [Gammaproteobacteria bacterium]MDH5803004.1 peptide deformylase [Gammaproteobacteria bacterium]